MGQSSAIHDCWGQAFVPGTHSFGMGLEGRVHFVFGKKPDGVEILDARGALRYQSMLWTVVSLFVGHAALGEGDDPRPAVFSSQAGQEAWTEFRVVLTRICESEGTFHPATASVLNKHEVHAAFIVLTNHLCHRAHEYLQWLTATLRRPVALTDLAAVDGRCPPALVQSLYGIDDRHMGFLACYLGHVAYGALAVFNEMKLPLGQRDGAAVISEVPRAALDPIEEDLGKLLRSVQGPRVTITDVNRFLFKYAGRRDMLARLYRAAAAAGLCQLGGPDLDVWVTRQPRRGEVGPWLEVTWRTSTREDVRQKARDLGLLQLSDATSSVDGGAKAQPALARKPDASRAKQPKASLRPPPGNDSSVAALAQAGFDDATIARLLEDESRSQTNPSPASRADSAVTHRASKRARAASPLSDASSIADSSLDGSPSPDCRVVGGPRLVRVPRQAAPSGASSPAAARRLQPSLDRPTARCSYPAHLSDRPVTNAAGMSLCTRNGAKCQKALLQQEKRGGARTRTPCP